jgi:hypothetical protein
MNPAGYLGELFGLMRKAEAELGPDAAHIGILLMLISAAAKHKSVSEVCDWLEKTAQDTRARISRH